MERDPGTFLPIASCVGAEVDQRKLAPRRGARPAVSARDVLALAVAVLCQWPGHRCERCFLRYVRRHWRGSFPRLTSQRAFHRRVRHRWAALCLLGPAVAREVSR